MDDDDLYDEFGNYIGGDAEGSDEDEAVDNGNDGSEYVDGSAEVEDNSMDVDEDESEPEGQEAGAVVLHEEKVYYPSASDVFGDDVEVVVQERDTQSISQPIIAPETKKKFTFENADLPSVNYKREFQASLMQLPDQMRNVALVGHLHHGKTSFLDMLVKQTHDINEFKGRMQNEQLRYTDIHVLERKRGLTIMNAPMSLVLPNRKSKSHLINVMDTPGHVDFIDEVVAAGRLVDGFMVVLDVVEGLSVNTERVIKHAIQQDIPFVLVVNKVDRLILELNLPPNDAYAKMVHCIEQVNNFIREVSPANPVRLTPEVGNVIFASAKMEWCFSLQSFADMYSQRFPGLDSTEFAKRLWGNIYYNTETRKFTKKKQGEVTVRGFIHFILNPLYKLYSHTVSEDVNELSKTLAKLNIRFKPSAYKMDKKPFLKVVCKEFFGEATAFVDCVVNHIRSPLENARSKVSQSYLGPIDEEDPVVRGMLNCNPDGPLAVQVTKLYNSKDASEFYALGRVMSGTIRKGQEVKVMGESFTNDDQEDSYNEEVLDLWVPMSRYKIPMEEIPAGCWCLIKGVDSKIAKTATIMDADIDLDETFTFRPLKHMATPFVKLAVEPLNPSELPRMLDGLRKVTKSYVLLKNVVEDSGEHIIFGSGELYMDCVMHDLRHLFADVEIKVSDPSTSFCETCIETSALQCSANTPNKKNKLTFLAEPLDDGIAEDIENNNVDIHWPVKRVAQHFQEKFGWDKLAARNIWAFGPEDNGPNILVNDTFAYEVDRRQLNEVRDHIRGGFAWVCKEGPLCGEPLRNTRFRLFNADLDASPIMRSGGQVIPASRRACNAAFLLAAPRLLEPVYSVHVTCKDKAVDHIYQLLQRRRGSVFQDDTIAGTPLSSVIGQIPVIDSFGFETDLRIATGGDASVSLVFDRWQLVPGDPLDKDQKTLPLQAARSLALARDFVLKTRKRKGLSEEPTIASFVDSEMLENLKNVGRLIT